MGPSITQCEGKQAVRADSGDHLDIFGVRITPPFIEFKQAFEGKTYKEKLSIQNVGKTKIVVRITPPTSSAYKIKPVRGQSLSPGLSIVREVTYIYSHATTPMCILTIYIDENRFDYQLSASLSTPHISITPNLINFGLMDVGCTSDIRTIVIQNTGEKSARFYIDGQTTNNYALIVEPLKGLLPAKNFISISIKLITYKEGNILIDLWVNVEELCLVQVTADVIRPRFEPISNCLATTFTLIDFPITYVGLTSIVPLYVKNYSSKSTMYCFMGQIGPEVMNLEDCCKREMDFRFFRGIPDGGVFHSKETKKIYFEFHPTEPRPGEKEKQFYFCTILICRVDAKFLTMEDYTEMHTPLREVYSLNTSRSSWASCLTFDQTCDLEVPLAASTLEQCVQLTMPAHPLEFQRAKLYLHGIAERAAVTTTPDELALLDLLVGQREIRVLELRNLSTQLPIILLYKKVAFVEVEKSTIHLEPYGTLQLAVYITPKRIGKVETKIRFDLVYYDNPRTNDGAKVIGKVVVPLEFEAKSVTRQPSPQINMGITPNYLNEAGKFCQELRFCTPIEKPKAAIVARRLVSKSSTALMALPNETRQSLRPWRGSSKCKTLFTKTPRYVPPLESEYELTVFDKRVKIERGNYYMNYLRQEAERLKLPEIGRKGASEYDISPRGRRLCLGYKQQVTRPLTVPVEPDDDNYYPLMLTVKQLNNIVVDPKVVHTGPMAAQKSYEFKITVKNRNDVSIYACVVSDKTSVTILDDHKKIIKPNEETKFSVVFTSSSLGYYTNELKVIFNDCAFSVVNVFAYICPTTLTLSTELLLFSEQTLCKYVDVINPLNAEVFFKWTLHHKNFEIAPAEGRIQANGNISCSVQYYPQQDGPSMVEALLCAGGRIATYLKLVVKFTSVKLSFKNAKVEFRDLPLNIPRLERLVLKNDSLIPQSYLLMDHDFKEFIEVFPKQGVVYPQSYDILFVRVKMTACVVFSVRLKIQLIKAGVIELEVKGNVVYPDVIIHPKTLHFKKIPSNTVDIIKFTVQNKSDAVASITFDSSMYPEFKITESDHVWDINEVNRLVLKRQSSIHLYARFAPFAATTDKFYLPFVINDILGPVVSEMGGRYVTCFLVDSVPNSTPVPMPKQLPFTTVLSYAMEPKLSISKMLVVLTCAPASNTANYVLKISNPQKEIETFCIRTDQLAPPLYFAYLKGKEVTQNARAITCCLDPGETVYFDIFFRPEVFGEYKAALPIFLRSDYSEKPHNCLLIKGEYPSPMIKGVRSNIYYKPMPLKVRACGSRRFLLENHLPDCEVTATCSLDRAGLSLVDREKTGKNTEEIWLRLSYLGEECMCVKFEIYIDCSCGARTTITAFGTLENCFLTNYAMSHTLMTNSYYKILPMTRNPSMDTVRVSHQLSITAYPLSELTNMAVDDYDLTNSFRSYPLFPMETDPLFHFLETCVQVVENWLYTQGFWKRSFYKLPDGISHVTFEKVEKRKQDFTTCIPPYIELLINLAGDQMKDYFDLEPVDDTEMERSKYIYNLYSRALDFLRDQGASLIWTIPQYMMPFYMYTFYLDISQPEAEKVLRITDIMDFQRLSKQCWLDVLLQTYKVLVYPRLIKTMRVTHPDQISLASKYADHNQEWKIYRHSIKDLSLTGHFFSVTEVLLLNWLRYHYDDVRRTYWAENQFLEERDMVYFGQNMEDGYVYAAVTLAYCPYLEGHYRKLFPAARTSEEVLHNNIIVIQGWDILNFSIGLTVFEITKPHSLRTLTTMAYLYEVLPDMFPSEIVEFKVGLSQQETKLLTIRNNNDFPVGYQAILYGNDDGCFQLKRQSFTIQPNGRCKVLITYHAKFLKRSHCTLILSGEVRGYHYARNKVVTLLGEPDPSFTVAEFSFEIEMSKIFEEKLKVTSPYEESAEYKIQFMPDACTVFEDLEEKCEYNRLPFNISRCMPMEGCVEVDKVAEINIVLVALTLTTVPTWIYFRNATVGDFAIKVITKALLPLKYEVLTVNLPKEDSCPGRGKIREMPQLFLEIPFQNRVLWSVLAEMLLKLSTDDVRFWKYIMTTTTGMHVLQRLLRFTAKSTAQLDLCNKTEFTVITDRRCKVILPETITIDDECRTGCMKVPIHLLEKRNPHSFTFILQGTSLEFRKYKVHFVQAASASATANVEE